MPRNKLASSRPTGLLGARDIARRSQSRALVLSPGGGAAPCAKKQIDGGNSVARLLNRYSFNGQGTRQPAIVEGCLAQTSGVHGLLSGSRRIAASQG
jgi:hypothetical protein